MRLPNCELGLVPREKVVDYLLSMTHQEGRHKAAFFRSFGFGMENWVNLADALRRHASDHDVAKMEDSPFGTRYVVEGTMEMADGREVLLRTVWFIDTDAEIPRFVTAYPS